jgi:D-alanyl-D-alanine dipeptidase
MGNRFEPQYVADPAKGSIHNRGGAVDITLVDANYNELDMGTPFDFFWKRPAMVMINYQMKYNNRIVLKV